MVLVRGGLWLDGAPNNPTGIVDHTTFAFNTAPGSGSFDGATVGGIGWTLSNSIFYNQSIGNIWNPLDCEANQFSEGGGNYQYPDKKEFCNGCSADALCTPKSTFVNAKQQTLDPWQFCTQPESSAIGSSGATCSQTDYLFLSYIVTYVAGNIPLVRTPFCITFTTAGGQQTTNTCPTRPLGPPFSYITTNGTTNTTGASWFLCTLVLVWVCCVNFASFEK